MFFISLSNCVVAQGRMEGSGSFRKACVHKQVKSYCSELLGQKIMFLAHVLSWQLFPVEKQSQTVILMKDLQWEIKNILW